MIEEEIDDDGTSGGGSKKHKNNSDKKTIEVNNPRNASFGQKINQRVAASEVVGVPKSKLSVIQEKINNGFQ